MMNDRKLFLSNTTLKIIALIAMTFDHIGIFLGDISNPIVLILRIIGRISFPLYLFLLTEGLKHTHNKWNYLLKLGIMAVIIYFGIFIINSPLIKVSSKFSLDRVGNIFFELFLYALTYILFTLPNKKMKFLGILPILVIITSSIIKFLSISTFGYVKYHFIYDGLYIQYDILGLLLFGGILLCQYLYDIYCKKTIESDDLFLSYHNSNNYLFYKDLFISFYIILLSVIFYIVEKLTSNQFINTFINLGMTSYIVFSIPFIILYNGKLGYTNKIIKNAFYLYYPIHIVIIFIIFYLISLK